MEKAAKGITPAEEIMVTTEEIVAEAKEEATEAPSRLHEIWKRAGTLFFQAPTNRIWASDLSEAIAREGRPPRHQE
jgi:hypothetical protein